MTLTPSQIRTTQADEHPRSVGRPAEMAGGKRVNVYLDAASLARAAQLGHGNVSEGIRVALAASADTRSSPTQSATLRQAQYDRNEPAGIFLLRLFLPFFNHTALLAQTIRAGREVAPYLAAVFGVGHRALQKTKGRNRFIGSWP